MEKLKMQSENLVNENIGKIAELFPDCVTEGFDNNGKLIKMIDFDLLKQELSDIVVEDNDERYTMTWPGKKQAILTANSPINATLRPCREESVDFDNTQNLYIEGDNLDVLKLLRETYLNKVKMIYIDPPYNTGNDFVYEDDYATSAEEYLQASKSYDEQGNKLFQNNDSNGRFHSDWLSMMYSRLKLAKDLLADDGVIFISIDDNEIDNLIKLGNEVFGEKNFISNLIWQSTGGSNTGTSIVTVTEYILIFAKNKENVKIKLLKKNDENYTLKDKYFEERGGYYLQKLDGKFTPSHYTDSLCYPIVYKGKEIWPGGEAHKSNELWNWRWSKTKTEWGIQNEFIEFIENAGKVVVKFKNYELVDNQGNPRVPSVPPKNIIGMDVCTTATGTSEIYNIFNNDYFPFPKSSKLIRYLLNLIDINDGFIMDFFSGSATTAHAVMQLNAEDGGNRKYICVQLPEKCDEKSEAFKAGYKNICEIGKERIRRAGKKILEQMTSNKGQVTNDNCQLSNVNYKLDIGFRVLKLDSSCMKDIYYNPEDITQDLLTGLEDNIKEDRTPEDVLFQVMLDMGVLLSSKIEEKIINNKKVFIVGEYDNDSQPNLICCFDNDLTDDVVTEIAKMQPLYAVFRDCSIATDSVSVNFEQIFETYSPTTKRRVI